MAERKINPLWTACHRLIETTELIDSRINIVCKRFYENKDKPEFAELIETLDSQINEYRKNAYNSILMYHMDISDDEYEKYKSDLKEVVTAIDNHEPFPEHLDNPVLKDFYTQSITLDTTLNVCLPE